MHDCLASVCWARILTLTEAGVTVFRVVRLAQNRYSELTNAELPAMSHRLYCRLANRAG